MTPPQHSQFVHLFAPVELPTLKKIACPRHTETITYCSRRRFCSPKIEEFSEGGLPMRFPQLRVVCFRTTAACLATLSTLAFALLALASGGGTGSTAHAAPQRA